MLSSLSLSPTYDATSPVSDVCPREISPVVREMDAMDRGLFFFYVFFFRQVEQSHGVTGT